MKDSQFEEVDLSDVDSAKAHSNELLVKSLMSYQIKSAIHFTATEPGSQFYTDLNQILATMRYLKMNKTLLASRSTGRYRSDIPLYNEIDYIIKGLENTIEKGYKIQLK